MSNVPVLQMRGVSAMLVVVVAGHDRDSRRMKISSRADHKGYEMVQQVKNVVRQSKTEIP